MSPKIAKVKSNESSLKATKQIKHLLKKGKWPASLTEAKASSKNVKATKIARKRGIIYVGRIPHGFYENELKNYFSQFGRVTRVRVNRSEKTGRSKSFGYVEFAEPKVAEIAAETMNNYLMCKKILKVEYIPPEKQENTYFTKESWSETNHPRKKHRSKAIKRINANTSLLTLPKIVTKAEKTMAKLKNKLQKIGVDLDFKLSDNPFEPLPDCKLEQNGVVQFKESDNDDSFATDSENDEIEINLPHYYKNKSKPSANIKAHGEKLLKKTKGGIQKTGKKIAKISKEKNEAVKKNIKEMLQSDNVVKSMKKIKYQSKASSTPLLKKLK